MEHFEDPKMLVRLDDLWSRYARKNLVPLKFETQRESLRFADYLRRKVAQTPYANHPLMLAMASCRPGKRCLLSGCPVCDRKLRATVALKMDAGMGLLHAKYGYDIYHMTIIPQWGVTTRLEELPDMTWDAEAYVQKVKDAFPDAHMYGVLAPDIDVICQGWVCLHIHLMLAISGGPSLRRITEKLVKTFNPDRQEAYFPVWKRKVAYDDIGYTTTYAVKTIFGVDGAGHGLRLGAREAPLRVFLARIPQHERAKVFATAQASQEIAWNTVNPTKSLI